MIISAFYKNKMLYYTFMKDFLEKKISAWEFREKCWGQRNKDLDENKKNGRTFEYYENLVNTLRGNEKKFKKEYYDYLYDKSWSANCLEALKYYEEGARKLDIKGEWFFEGIHNFIDEYIREYYPSNDEGFDPKFNIDEKTLREKIQAAFDVLERNKDRWM